MLSTRAAVRRSPGGRRLGAFALHLALGLGALAMILPLIWMLSTSFRLPKDLYVPELFPPQATLANYWHVLLATAFPHWFLNSLLVAGVTTASVVFFDSLTGYALAKFDFPGRRLVFIGILSTLMVPTELLVIPWYMMSRTLGWTDTYWGIMFPGLMTGFGVFLMRQFFQSVPNELLDAARIDGLSEFGVFRRIALPLVRPALAALGILTFLGNWNAYLWPLIVINSPAMQTLPVGVSIFSTEAGAEYQYIMAAASLATVPVIAVFILFQRQIIRGIALTGIKA